jgi:uncharacterized protein
LPLHAASIKRAILIPFLLCSTSSWATDIQCASTQQPAQRVICDHAILNHEYDDIYEQQQKLIQQGKLATSDLAAWRHKRDACIEVHCIDGVFAEWSTIGKRRENSAAPPVITASQALGIPSALPASSAVAEASQQSSSVPVARQGSAYGIALPQPVASDASAPAPVSASAATVTPGRASSNPLLVVLSVLLLIVVSGVCAMVIYQRRRQR